MMKPAPHTPMPMRPRLPQSGRMIFALPPTANPTISYELADVTCDDSCNHEHHHHDDDDRHDQKRSASVSINPPRNTKKAADAETSRLGPLVTPPPLVSPLAHLDASFTSTSSECETTPFQLTDVHSMDHDHGASLFSLGLFDFDEDDDDDDANGDRMGQKKHNIGLVDSQQHKESRLPGLAEHAAMKMSPTPPSLSMQYQHQQSDGAPNLNVDVNGNVTHTILHQTCLLFPNDASVVRTAILGYPHAVFERCPLPMNNFSLPLHIALSKSATFPVVQQLVNAGPSVLLEKDGPDGLTPLALALTKNASHQVLGLLLRTRPQAAGIMCGPQQDLPLHIVCRQAPVNPQQMEVMEALIPANTAALHQVNGQGLTPIDMVMIQLQQLQRRQQLLSPGDNSSSSSSTLAQQNLFRVLASLKHAANMAPPLTPNGV